ncbi:acylneuraminate cytidylyltransferase family protein [bacterium]|nr:acylneuraminate cytidylyltransferase family protein [bacterium]
MENQIIVFLPCRKGSQRVLKKNIRPFAGQDGGLTRIKLKQLLKTPSISQIVLSSDDDEVLEIGASFNSEKIIINHRPKYLASSSTSTDELINFVPEIIQSGHILWTHVTSPFIDEMDYEKIIRTYIEGLQKGYDSLMTVTKLHKFLWTKQGALNYDRSKEKWPRTQTLDPVFEINSGAFLTNIQTYKEEKDRIGKNPLLFEMDEMKSYDIDWEVNFKIAEQIYING